MSNKSNSNTLGITLKININQPWEIAYWSQRFGVKKDRLISAIHAVGPMVADVKKYLKK